jgi:hypothetical protein
MVVDMGPPQIENRKEKIEKDIGGGATVATPAMSNE